MSAPSVSAPASSAVDIRAHPVVIEKSVPQSATLPPTVSYVCGFLTLFYEPDSNTALTRLRLLVAPEDNTSIYLQICPEQIIKLVEDRTNTKSPKLAQLCGSPAAGSVALRFTLDKPVTVVGPLQWPLPIGNVKQEALEDAQCLASQTELVVHVPHGADRGGLLRSFSFAASRRGYLSTNASQANLKHMYRGRGGKVVQLLESAIHDIVSPTVPPPAYDQLPRPSQKRQASAEPSAPSKKRRGEGSGAPNLIPQPEVSEAPELPQALPAMQAEVGIDASVAAMDRSEHLRDQYRSYIEMLCGEVMDIREKRLEEALGKREADFRAEICAELQSSEARIMARVEEMGNDIEARLVDMIHEDYAEYASKVDLEDVIDDRVAGIKLEMEDFVKDEMLSVQEQIVDHFESGTFYARFSRAEDD